MIAYYAHGHGSGHCNYANIFYKVFGNDLFVLTDATFDFDHGTSVVRLVDEHLDGNEFDRIQFPEPGALHYAPVNMKKIAVRNRCILDNIIDKAASLMIIDVSVEIAMLARISSVPYAYVRLMGNRDDLPHLNAYQGACFLLAYFPRELESEGTPSWIIEKTVYLGFLSKFAFDTPIVHCPREFENRNKPILLLLNGFGGSANRQVEILAGQFDIFRIGPNNGFEGPEYLNDLGVVRSTRPYVVHADIIVAACGMNTTSEILSQGRTFIAVAENRHFDEQKVMAARLHCSGLATDAQRYQSIKAALSAHLTRRDLGKCGVDNKELNQFHGQLKNVDFRVDEYHELIRR